MSESLSSSHADGGSYAVHDSRAPSLGSGGESPPSSPTGHNWEINYQEAAIYLQVSVSDQDLFSVPVGRVGCPGLCCVPRNSVPALVPVPAPVSTFREESQPDRAQTGRAMCVGFPVTPRMWPCLSPRFPESVRLAFPASLPILRH